MIFKIPVQANRRGLKLFAALFVLLSLISCTNIIEDEIKPVEKTEVKSDKEDVQKNVQISGLLKLTGALPSEIVENLSLYGSYLSLPGFTGQARTAFPSIPTSGFTYEIKAINTEDETDFCTGSPSEDLSSYTITIPATSTEKEYKIQASVRLSGFESEYIFLSGQSEEFPISLTSPVMTKDVTLKPLTGESGIMDLAVNVSGSGIRSAKATVNFSEYSHAYIQADMEDDILTFHTGTHTEDELEDGLSSGTWPVTFDFYKSTNCTGEKAYSFTEVVNIFSNLSTNTWVQNGSEPWFVTTGTGASKTTTCRITAAMVEGYALTDIFVDSSRSTSSGATNYTTESGSFINPCTTFSKAIERLTDSTKDYTINITGTLAGAQTIPSTISAKTLTVYGSSESIYRLLQAAPLTIPVTYKNIIFENGCADESPGGGGINNQGTLTLDNCIIQSCDGDVFNGGGVFNNGTLTLLSGTITGNTAQNGAGVYIEDGAQMTMSGGTISGNESGGSSGAVHVGTNSLFTMTGGTISGNKADVGEGGGLFIESPGTFIMSGGTISGNSAISGGALYVEGTFKISGSAYIPAGVNGVTGVGKNDVRIIGNNKIKIAGKLNPPATCTDGIVATITPSSYTAGTQLIELDTGVTDTSLAEAAAHFAVTQPVDGTNLFIVSNEGKLATITPVLSFDNGEEDGTQTNPDDGKVYDVVKYSYLGDDNLKVSAVNPYESEGFSITFLVDDNAGDLTDRAVTDGFHTLTIRVSKAGYASVDISKRVYVKIKPVKVTIGQIEVYFDTNGEGSHSSGQAYISGDGYAAHEMYIEGDAYPDASSKKKTCRTVVDNSNDGRTGNSDNAVTYKYNPDSTKNYVYLTEKTSKFYFYTNRAHCTYMNLDLCQINKDDSTTTRTLSSLKPTDGRSFATGDVNWAGNHVSGGGCPRGYYSFSVSLDDSEDPPAP